MCASTLGRMRFGAALLVTGLLLAGCSSHNSTQQIKPAPQQTGGTALSTLPPTTTHDTVPGTLPPRPLAAYAVRATKPTISVYASPDKKLTPEVLPNPWVVDPSRPDSKVEQVFLVQQGKYVPGWYRVLLPVRPNGSTGWVRSTDVAVEQIVYKIRIQLAAHLITVLNGTNVIYQGPIAIGKPSTPTPTGRYYIRVLIQAPNPNTVYGPYAYGLSSHSDVLSNFNGGDGEIGIHGNDDSSVLGRSVTHGCIRIDNDAIARLAGVLPLGTPVDVEA